MIYHAHWQNPSSYYELSCSEELAIDGDSDASHQTCGGDNFLTATFFETGTYATPTKSQNLTILGLGDPDSTQ